jgi:threonine/homoserine/homoserine lactone efflux protein
MINLVANVIDMIEAITTGVLLGCVLSLLIGPVFFMLLNTSIRKGFVPAAYLAVGVMLSDAFLVMIAYFGSTTLKLLQNHQNWVGLAGGIVLMIFGMVNILKKPVVVAQDLELPDDSKSLLIDTGKGFMMNILNPFVLLFWLGVSGTVATKEHASLSYSLFFFGSALVTILTTDLLKAWLASSLKNIIRPNFLLWLNRISGAGLIIYGCIMLVRLFYLRK